MSEFEPCSLCHSGKSRVLHEFNRRRILRCAGCGLVRVHPLPSPQEIARLEESAFCGELLPETRHMFDSYHRDFTADPVVRDFQRSLELLEGFTAGRKLLDVGVGTGLYLHLARERGWETLGIEICGEAARKAAEEFGLSIIGGAFEETDLPADFDAVAMADVLEHSRDPCVFVEKAIRLLKPGGVLYIALPNHNNLVFWTADKLGKIPLGFFQQRMEKLYVPNHLYYFTPATLWRLVSTVGFRPLHLESTRTYLGRYEISLPVKVFLATALRLGSFIGRPGRIAVFAVKPGPDDLHP